MSRLAGLRWRRALGGAIIAAVAIFLALPIGRYLLRAAWEEARILARRRPIAELVRDTAVEAPTRGKLALVLEARRFAQDSVRLTAGESFTTYSRLERDTLVLVVSAARRDRLVRHNWWFPIVGSVPYKGFFDFGAARKAARDLEGKGLDTYVRPASAFSTLGWFNDPLVTTTLRQDSVDLANTVIHELTHNTFYAPGEAVFNESFANFVGSRGGEWFYRARGDSAGAALSARRWEDEMAIGRFYDEVHHALDRAFAAHPADGRADSLARIAARDAIYAEARTRLVRDVAPRLTTIPAPALARVQLDNAVLLARRVYLTDLGLFERVYELEGGDLRRAITRIVQLARSREDDPYGALREWVGKAPRIGGGGAGDSE